MRKFFPSAIVFVLMLCIGFFIASKKPMSNDEFFSATSSTVNTTYVNMLVGNIPEGNNTPLFYFLQKVLVDLTPYKMPAAWLAGNWMDNDVSARLILRINPVVFMSLSIAFIFHFFCQRMNVCAGLLSLIAYLATYIVWPFWAEARPYALLVFLSTVQSLCLIEVVETKGSKGLNKLIGINCLLSLTSIFSLGLIASATVILWHSKIKSFGKYCLWMLIPLALIIFYYAHAPRYPFYFDLTPEQLIRDNVSRERFYIFIAFVICWVLSRFKKISTKPIVDTAYFKFFTSVFLATLLLIFMFKAGEKPKGEGFPVTSKYFIYLMPISVLCTVWACMAISRFLSTWRLAQYAFWFGVCTLLSFRFFKIVTKALVSLKGLGT